MPILNDPERLLSLSNGLCITAAVLAVLATCAIVHFGNKVTALKEQQLLAYKSDADARIAEAKSTANIAEQQTQEIRQVNILLQAQLDKEREARLVIQKHLTQRSLTESQKGTFSDALSKSQRVRITVAAVGGDAEAYRYANDFCEVLIRLGWNPECVTSIVQTGLPHTGIIILAQDENQGQVLQSLLSLMGVPSSMKTVQPGHWAKNLSIYIGHNTDYVSSMYSYSRRQIDQP